MRREHRDSEPCGSYAGNVCGGFGGKTVCLICGWPRVSLRRRPPDAHANPADEHAGAGEGL